MSISVNGLVTYKPITSSSSAPASRHDSVTSKSEKRLEIRDSTFAPLRVSGIQIHSLQDKKMCEHVVSVMTNSISVSS